jgi:hypothetical protein
MTNIKSKEELEREKQSDNAALDINFTMGKMFSEAKADLENILIQLKGGNK